MSRKRWVDNVPCVYFITDGEYVKIGRTENITQRMKSLQTASHKELTLIDVIPTNEPRIVEWGLHKRYEDKRVKGEWFDILPEILATRSREDPYLTPEDIERILQISKTSVYKLITRKDFPAIQIGDSYRVRRSELDMYIKLHSPIV